MPRRRSESGPSVRRLRKLSASRPRRRYMRSKTRLRSKSAARRPQSERYIRRMTRKLKRKRAKIRPEIIRRGQAVRSGGTYFPLVNRRRRKEPADAELLSLLQRTSSSDPVVQVTFGGSRDVVAPTSVLMRQVPPSFSYGQISRGMRYGFLPKGVMSAGSRSRGRRPSTSKKRKRTRRSKSKKRTKRRKSSSKKRTKRKRS